jgi:hypothetical protein
MGIEVNPFVGRVWKPEAKFTLPLPSMSSGMEVNFVEKTYGKQDWHQRRRYPQLGLGLTYINYGQDSIYGRCLGLYPNITIPLISGKHIEWTFRIGDGVGYVTRRYTRQSPSDTVNVAIGSHINDFASFMMDIRYHIDKHWDVQLGGNFNHISDASFHQPNLGINLYGGHIGFRYFPVTSHPVATKRDLKPLKNRWLFQLRYTMAFNQSNAPLGPTYPIYIGTAFVSRRWLSKNKMFGGIDYSFHQQIDAFLRDNPSFVTPGTEAQHSYKSAAFIGNEFLLGRVGIVLQAGYYLHQAYQTQGAVYEKLGGNLYLVKREHGPIKEFSLCAFLKTHLSVAEFAEFGMGIGF